MRVKIDVNRNRYLFQPIYRQSPFTGEFTWLLLVLLTGFECQTPMYRGSGSALKLDDQQVVKLLYLCLPEMGIEPGQMGVLPAGIGKLIHRSLKDDQPDSIRPRSGRFDIRRFLNTQHCLGGFPQRITGAARLVGRGAGGRRVADPTPGQR